jgi:hypothetical protein
MKKNNLVKNAMLPLAIFVSVLFAFFSSPSGSPVPQLDNQIVSLDYGYETGGCEDNPLGDLGVSSASASCPARCVITVCTWWVPGPSSQCPAPGPGGGCCLAYGPGCDPDCEDDPPPPAPTATPIPPTATPIPPTPTPIPPSVSGSVSCDASGNAGWCIGNANLNMTASDPQGNPVTIQGTIGGSPFSCAQGNTCSKTLPEGSGNIQFWAISTAGSSSHKSTSWKLDTNNPSLSPSLPAATGANGWHTSNISANLNASDAISGIVGRGISVNGGAMQVPPVALSDGVYTLTFWAKDAAGHTTTSTSTVSIDTTDPTVSAGANGILGSNGWYITSLDVTASGSDTLSGVASETLAINGGGAVSGTQTLNNGNYSVVYRVTDVAGNSASLTWSYKIDVSAPALAPSLSPSSPGGANGWYVVSPVIADLSAIDVTSGVVSSGVLVNGGGLESAPVNLSDGVFSLEFYAKNDAGLFSTAQRNASVDTQPPTLFPSVPAATGAHGWHIANVQIGIASSDATSGVDYDGIIVDGSNRSNPTILSEGVYSIEFFATDNAGLQSLAQQTISVDTTDPLLSLQKTGTQGEGGWYLSEVDIQAQYSDGLSGIDTIFYKIGSGAWMSGDHLSVGEGVSSVSFELTDIAGNQVILSETIRVDKTVPVTQITTPLQGERVKAYVDIQGLSSDSGSGVQRGEWSLDGGTWQAIDSFSANWSFVWNTRQEYEGRHTIRVRTYDLAGNMSNIATVDLFVQNKKPTATAWSFPWVASPTPQPTVTILPTSTSMPTSVYTENAPTRTPNPPILSTPPLEIFAPIQTPPKKAVKPDLGKASAWLLALATLAGLALLSIDPRPSALHEIEILGDQWMNIKEKK